ncbi:MAG: hypothetical protein KatS3mg076_1678 [Candidatus Binatia bacterium]|nr:MAG: hypothetical protein KatS3mg076_1678 [Candidatus Binatia bacterium]
MTRREFPAAALYEKRGPIAVVSLNRPEVHNAYDVRMRDALYEAFTAVRDDTEVRVLVLRGNGPSFSSGGDLREFGSAPSPLVARSVRRERDVWGVLLGLDALTVAAVHGYVLGGGWEMALLCDVCIASRDARFRFPETGLGLIPGVGGTQTLPRKAGLGYALDWILTGRWLSAEELRRAGLLERVVSRERLDAVALGMARSFARLDRTARRRLKQALRASQDFVGRNASGGTRSVASGAGGRARRMPFTTAGTVREHVHAEGRAPSRPGRGDAPVGCRSGPPGPFANTSTRRDALRRVQGRGDAPVGCRSGPPGPFANTSTRRDALRRVRGRGGNPPVGRPR